MYLLRDQRDKRFTTKFRGVVCSTFSSHADCPRRYRERTAELSIGDVNGLDHQVPLRPNSSHPANPAISPPPAQPGELPAPEIPIAKAVTAPIHSRLRLLTTFVQFRRNHPLSRSASDCDVHILSPIAPQQIHPLTPRSPRSPINICYAAAFPLAGATALAS